MDGPPKLIAITTGRALAEDCGRMLSAVAGGLPGLLLREPRMSDRDLLRYAAELRERSANLWLCIHDRAHLAYSPVFDAVHLGYQSLTPFEVRQIVSPKKAIGFSSHAHDCEESWRGADYLFFSPIKETPSKADLVEPTGFEGLRRAALGCSLPVLALGGLAPSDVGDCLDAGASGVACLSDISSADDPAARVGLWLEAFGAEQLGQA